MQRNMGFLQALYFQCAFSPVRVDARSNRNKMFADTNESRYALTGPYTTNN